MTRVLQGWRRYWLEFEVPSSKVRVFRVVVFALFALEAWLQIEHAARYGAGGFNVSHFPWLDGVLPMPTRPVMLVVSLLKLYLAGRLLFGVATRTSIVLLCVLYGYGYFCSQLDSYQHHYLLWLVLLLGCFVPWHATKDVATVRSWALRLILVQVALLYGWAAIAKTNGLWFSGEVLSQQLMPDGVPRTEWITDAIFSVLGESSGFATLAKLICAAEYTLALCLLVKRLWPVAVVLGVGLHVSIELSAFQIGLFSYYMFAFYLLILPAWVWRGWLAFEGGVVGLAGSACARLRDRVMDRLANRGLRVAVLGGAIALGSLPLLALPFEEAAVVAGLIALLGLAGLAVTEVRAQPSRGLALALAHVLVCSTPLLLQPYTTTTYDYYKVWAGSERRWGDTDEAIRLFEKLIDMRPSFGPWHYHRGRLHFIKARDTQTPDQDRAGHLARALASYRAAEQREPVDARPYAAEAKLHVVQNRRSAAKKAARAALEIDPKNARALRILRVLETQ